MLNDNSYQFWECKGCGYVGFMTHGKGFQSKRKLEHKDFIFCMNLMLGNEFSLCYKHWKIELVSFMMAIKILQRVLSGLGENLEELVEEDEGKKAIWSYLLLLNGFDPNLGIFLAYSKYKQSD